METVCPSILASLLTNRQYITNVHRVTTKVLTDDLENVVIQGNELYYKGTRMPLYVQNEILDLNLIHEDGFFSFPYYHGIVKGFSMSERITNFPFSDLDDVGRAYFLVQFYYTLDRLRTKARISFIPNGPLRFRRLAKRYLSYKGIYQPGTEIIHDAANVVPIFFSGRILQNTNIETQNNIFRELVRREEFIGFEDFLNATNLPEVVQILASYGPNYIVPWEITKFAETQKALVASTKYDNATDSEIMNMITQENCEMLSYLMMGGTIPRQDISNPALCKVEKNGYQMSKCFLEGKDPKDIFDKICDTSNPCQKICDYKGKEGKYRIKKSKVCEGIIVHDVSKEYYKGKGVINGLNEDLDCFAHTVSGYQDYYRDKQRKDIPYFVLIQENIRGKPVSSCMSTLSGEDFCGIFAQIVAILQHCNEKMYFTHGNCQPKNVLLRKNEEKEIIIPLTTLNIKIPTRNQVVLVDYQHTYAKPFENGVSSKNVSDDKHFSRPLEDLYTFLTITTRIAYKERNEEVYNLAIAFLGFFEQVGYKDKYYIYQDIMSENIPRFPPTPQDFEKNYSLRNFINTSNNIQPFKKVWQTEKRNTSMQMDSNGNKQNYSYCQQQPKGPPSQGPPSQGDTLIPPKINPYCQNAPRNIDFRDYYTQM